MFKRLCAARGYDADRFVSHGIDNGKQASARHPDKHKAILAIVVTIIDEFDSKRVLENTPRRLEPNTMLGVVGGGFLVVPLELSRSPVKLAPAQLAPPQKFHHTATAAPCWLLVLTVQTVENTPT
jgi:hypothetical protein